MFSISLLKAFLRRFLGGFSAFRLFLRDVILNFAKNMRISLNKILMIVDIVFLRLAGPRVLADHVEIGFNGLLKPLILLE